MLVSKSMRHLRGGKVTTRAQLKKNKSKPKSSTTLSNRRIYRSRVKTSVCRGKPSKTCRSDNKCKLTKTGTRKSYCRKHKNHSAIKRNVSFTQ